MNIQFPNNSFIEAEYIHLGKNFQIGNNVQIRVRGKFIVDSFGRFGNNVTINAEEVSIGKHFYHYTDGLNIGGGGSQFPEASLSVGDRCVFHNNYINLARAVVIGNDVGLSPDVDIITHGFWNSVLEGYPTTYKGILISDGVIVGQRSMILPGVTIGPNIVVGANSTVASSLLEFNSIYAGNPAKFIRTIKPLLFEEKRKKLTEILERFNSLASVHVVWNYPLINIEEATVNVETKEIIGIETETTDKLRDFLRRYGIRIYTERPFLSL